MSDRVERVAVHGAGRMGLPITAGLVRAGYAVRAFDVRDDRQQAVTAAGAQWSPALEGVDVLLTVLPGSPELRAAMLGDGGLLDRLGTGADWLDLTSAAPHLDAELAAQARDRGIGYLDCGLGGGPAQAQDRTLTLYVGGADDALARCRPVLEAFADPDRIHRMGAAGTGHLAKLLVNLLWFAQAVAVGEALLLAQDNGIEADHLAGVLRDGPADSEFLRGYVPRLLSGDYLRDFGIDRVVEELDSIESLLHARNVPLDLTAAVARVHRAALERFGPQDGELLGVAHLEHLAGRTLRDGE